MFLLFFSDEALSAAIRETSAPQRQSATERNVNTCAAAHPRLLVQTCEVPGNLHRHQAERKRNRSPASLHACCVTHGKDLHSRFQHPCSRINPERFTITGHEQRRSGGLSQGRHSSNLPLVRFEPQSFTILLDIYSKQYATTSPNRA